MKNKKQSQNASETKQQKHVPSGSEPKQTSASKQNTTPKSNTASRQNTASKQAAASRQNPASKQAAASRQNPAPKQAAASKQNAASKQAAASRQNAASKQAAASRQNETAQKRQLDAIPAASSEQLIQEKHTSHKVIDILASIVLLCGFGVAVGYPLVTGMIPIDPLSGQEAIGTVQSTDNSGNVVTEPVIEPASDAFFENITLEYNEIYKGPLLLVNSDYPFLSAADAKITTLFEEKTDSYSVSGMDISMQAEAVPALNDMLDAFFAATGHDDILIVDGYRTLEQQQLLYDADLEQTGSDASTLVAKPGHSEHETGYALDFSLFFNDGTSGEYDGTGDYEWIDQHCADYGFILRYPENKTDITGIQHESWHYRYVGHPHAYYIMQSGICLEEYILELKNYSVENPLEIVDSDGAAYAVYYVAADTAAGVTYAPILPNHPYAISGNNVDGFIITVDLEETRELVSYTKPAEETTGMTTDENGMISSSDGEDIAATTITTTVDAVG